MTLGFVSDMLPSNVNLYVFVLVCLVMWKFCLDDIIVHFQHCEANKQVDVGFQIFCPVRQKSMIFQVKRTEA